MRGSEIETDIRRSRNMRQPFSRGFLVGGAIANMMEISGGRFPGGRWATHDDATVDVFIGDRDKDYPKPDGKTTFDKLSSVFLTGNATRDDAPNHIRIQDKVPLDVALMWQNMCPAAVYEVPEDELEAARSGNGAGRQRQARRQARGQAADHPLELRAVRGDHREGRQVDSARGRRRPELPGHLRVPVTGGPPGPPGTPPVPRSSSASRRSARPGTPRGRWSR